MADAQFAFALTAQDMTGPAFQAATKNARALKEQVSSLKSPMEELKGAAEGIKSRIDLMIGNEVVQRLVEFHKQVQEQVGGLQDQADGLNLSTDQLQGYISAFAKAGYSNEEARASLVKFNQTLGEATLGNKGAIDSFNLLGIKILDAGGKMRDPNVIMAEAASKLLALDNGSQRTALSMQIFGRSGGQLTPVLRDLTGGVQELVDNAKTLGTVSTPEVIAQFEELNKKSNTLNLQVRTLYGSFAAPIETKAIENASSNFARLASNLTIARKQYGDLLALVMAPGLLMSGAVGLLPTQAEAADKEVNKLERSVASIQGRLGKASPAQAPMLQEALAIAQARLESARVLADEAHRGAAGGIVLPTVTVTAPAPGGDHNPAATGGGGKRDRIGEEIARLQLQTEAAETALRNLMDPAKNGMPLEDLQRAVALEKQISDEIASATKFGATKAQKDQITALITAQDTATAAAKRRNDALNLADQTEKTYGTNSLAFAEQQTKLAAAFDTGRISVDAYNLALKQGSEAAEDLRLKNIGLKGGADAFIAGWQNQQNQFTRANSAFAAGGQVFDSVMSSSSQALDQWANNGQVNFNKLLGSFFLMIAQMEIRYAASTIWKAIEGGGSGGGGGGGLFGSLFSGISSLFGGGGGGGASTVLGQGIGVVGGAFAAGGDPPVGVPSLVGENGPELFTPKTAGTITPNGQLGGNSVVVHQYNTFGSDVNRAELKLWAEQVRKNTEASIVSKMQHGGKFATAIRK